MEKLIKEQTKLLNDLNNADEQIVLKSLEIIREKGGEYIVLPLMEKFFNTESEYLKDKIGDIFADLKNNKAADIISDNILRFENHRDINIFLDYVFESAISINKLQPFMKMFFSNDLNQAIICSDIIEENYFNVSDEEKNACKEIFCKNKNNLTNESHIELVKIIEEVI